MSDHFIARSVVIAVAGFSRSGRRAMEILHPFAPPADFHPALILSERQKGIPFLRAGRTRQEYVRRYYSESESTRDLKAVRVRN
jgi:hypothetical protein